MSDQLTIKLAPVTPDEPGVKIYVSPDAKEELRAFLESEGYDASEAAEFSAGVELAILAVVLFAHAGGFSGFAEVLRAFCEKNQHKSITLTAGDRSVEIKGMSKGQMESVAKEFVGIVEEQQRQLDESWHRILEEMPDPPKQLPKTQPDESD